MYFKCVKFLLLLNSTIIKEQWICSQHSERFRMFTTLPQHKYIILYLIHNLDSANWKHWETSISNSVSYAFWEYDVSNPKYGHKIIFKNKIFEHWKLCAIHYSKCFTNINLLSYCIINICIVPSENWSPERLTNLPMVTQQVGGRARIWI